jgi:peptidoglycan/LPS O-acetylase OafA/YrhL
MVIESFPGFGRLDWHLWFLGVCIRLYLVFCLFFVLFDRLLLWFFVVVVVVVVAAAAAAVLV